MVEQNDDILEKLSALSDGELNDFETRQLLKQLDQLEPSDRNEIHALWARMQFYRDTLQENRGKHNTNVFVRDAKVLTNISAVIDEEWDHQLSAQASDDDDNQTADIKYLGEPDVAQEVLVGSAGDNAAVVTSKVAPTWSKLAVAASVALAVVVGFQQVQLSEQTALLAQQAEPLQSVSALAASIDVNDSELETSIAEDVQQAELIARIEAANSAQEQLAAQRSLIEYLRARQQLPVDADPFARVANFEEQGAAVERPVNKSE